MFKLAWGALFGNPLYALLGFGSVLLLASGYAGVKGYQFGADRQKVLCEVRVNAIKLQIEHANEEIEKNKQKVKDALAEIEAERDAETRRAEEAEALSHAATGAYQDEITKRTDGNCLPTDADINSLQ
jgi:hypothetical protein